jgi:hypothetical protein
MFRSVLDREDVGTTLAHDVVGDGPPADVAGMVTIPSARNLRPRARSTSEVARAGAAGSGQSYLPAEHSEKEGL